MTTLIAATGNDVVRIAPDNRDQWTAELLFSGVGVQCVAVDPHDGNRIYAGTFDQGVFLSADGGRSWSAAGDGIPHTRVLSIAVSPSDRSDGIGAVLAGTEASSLYRSRDGGMTWQDMPALRDLPSSPTWSFPPRPWTSHVRWIAPHWQDPNLLFTGIELGGVMRSVDGGETWEDRKPGSYHDSHAVMVHPTAVDRVYEAAGGGVSVSFNAGESWSEVDGGMDRHYVWGLAVDPADPELWYVSATFNARYAHGDRSSAEAFIYRRRGSEPWTVLAGGLPNPLSVMPYALLTPLDRPGELYAGLRDGQIWHSADMGDSWNRLDVGLSGLLALAAIPA
jgi:ribosomal protein S18 acetylase RimI-like enzyme